MAKSSVTKAFRPSKCQGRDGPCTLCSPEDQKLEKQQVRTAVTSMLAYHNKMAEGLVPAMPIE